MYTPISSENLYRKRSGGKRPIQENTVFGDSNTLHRLFLMTFRHFWGGKFPQCKKNLKLTVGGGVVCQV